MKSVFRDVKSSIDWILLAAALPLVGAGLVTMNSFSGESAYFYNQIVWIPVALIAFFVVSMFDLSFLKRTGVIVTLYSIICGLLILLFALGTVSKGAQSWFSIGLFSVQPSDPAQIVLILLLAKYFSRRHIEIRNIRHILVSGLYALIAFALIIVQPDFGGAIIIFFIWFGMVLVSGISKKHLLAVVMIGAVTFAGLWMYVFKDYQKARIMTFIHPLADIHGAGYNAYQSTIAVGSGQISARELAMVHSQN